MADPLKLDLHRPRVIYRQISEQIRDIIVSGKLAPGTKLPSSAELAIKWKTHPATIHMALAPLVKEGLLTRQPKIGTFVSKRSKRLTDIGIYYDSNIWRNQANAFKRAVHVELARLLEARKINMKVWFDPRGDRKRAETWTDLTSAAERREIQALIATDIPDEVVAWLQPLPVVGAYFTTAPVPNRVQLDFEQFSEASVALLKRQGCRSAGAISILEPGKPISSRSAASEDFYERFADICQKHRLEVRREWIRMAPAFVRDESQEEFGYNEFKAIWRQRQRPDGIAVFPDTSVPGVIISVLEQRVNVPADLKLVVHKHVEIDFLCPLEISYLYSSTAQIAQSLLAQVEHQFTGGVCEPIILPFASNLKKFRAPPASTGKATA